MKLFRNGSYATVVSSVALVVALGGTSYAAAKITGHDIKNNSVTSANVKNHNLKLKDFSAGATAGLVGPAGATGATGTTGATGAQGVQGPVGPSNAYSVYNDNGTALTGTTKTVLTLPVQPGSYVVNSKAWFFGTTVTGVCYLAGAGQLDYNAAQTSATEASATIANQLVFTTASATNVTLNCYGAGAVYWKKMTAIKVGSVTNTPGPNVSVVSGATNAHR